MKNTYDDIRSRISEEPTWYDEYGTPRYGEFHPSAVPDIYADEVALVLIACQACKTTFKVGLSTGIVARMKHPGRMIIAEAILECEVDYGDPPNADCCAVGPTMSSDSIRVLEYWHRRLGHQFERDPSFELTLDVVPDAERKARLVLMIMGAEDG